MTHEDARPAAVERDDDTAAEPDALEPERREWLLDASAHGQRVDKLLASLLMAFSAVTCKA